MQVILLKKIVGLGEVGDIKEVSEGYARNFLFVQNLAEPATQSNIEKLKKDQAEQVRKAEKDLLITEKIADRLNGLVIEIKSKANDAGKLYAAITPAMIVKKLKEKDFTIKKEQIILIEAIKELGEYPIAIQLNHGLEAEITIIVSE